MSTLIIPGVRVEARFDVLPPLPAAAGIVGIVGITDRPSADGTLVGVTKVAEIATVLGPGSMVTMPELVHALANGASEAVVSHVSGGVVAAAMLKNPSNNDVIELRCRAPGAWGNELTAEVRNTLDADRAIIRSTVRILRGGAVVETHADLRSSPGDPDDLLDTINSRSRYVVAIDPTFRDDRPEQIEQDFPADGDRNISVRTAARAGSTARDFLVFTPIGDANAATGRRLRITHVGPAAQRGVRVEVFQDGLQESFDNLVMDPDSDLYMPFVILTQSKLISVRSLRTTVAGGRLPAAGNTAFTLGVSPTVDQYAAAIDRLADDTRIDLVLASIEPRRSVAASSSQEAEVRQIHQALLSHAVVMADQGAPRIAFGSVTRDEQANVDAIRDHAAFLRSRRFVLVAPSGAEGAVAGIVGRLATQDSPTFNTVPLFEISPTTYRDSQLNRLLGPTINALVVQARTGRGVVVLKGIDTTGDQISVTRVADQCIRETKAISENFISRLNSDETRTALKQQIVATFTRLERAGALVPSTDGKDPAFVVDVYSTQQDFAQGIVRVDIAVRPVRAIDYVYATIRVKN